MWGRGNDLGDSKNVYYDGGAHVARSPEMDNPQPSSTVGRSEGEAQQPPLSLSTRPTTNAVQRLDGNGRRKSPGEWDSLPPPPQVDRLRYSPLSLRKHRGYSVNL